MSRASATKKSPNNFEKNKCTIQNRWGFGVVRPAIYAMNKRNLLLGVAIIVSITGHPVFSFPGTR